MRIGWVKDDEILLLPEAAYSVAVRLAQEQGETLAGSLDMIKRDLKEQRLLIRTDKRRRTITVRRTAEGEEQDVLLICYETFRTASSDGCADAADDADATDLERETHAGEVEP